MMELIGTTSLQEAAEAAGGGGGGGSFAIGNSLSFNSADEAHLTRNISSNITTFTLSMWVKRHGSARDDIFVTDSGTGFFFYFDTNGKLKINTNTGNIFESTGVYRDPSAWYHICINNNGTTFNLYMNGVLDKSVTVSTALSSGAMLFGRDRLTTPGNHSDISLAEIHFVEGQALDQTDFGEFDTTTGIWNPKEFSGTYGGAGFHLDFANGATDSSSNTNNFTASGVVATSYSGQVQYGEASTFDNSFDTNADVTLDTTGYSYSTVTSPKTDTGDANNATVLKTADGTAIYWVFSDDNENTNRYIHQSANGINWTGALYQTSNGPVTIGPTPWVAWAGGANVDVTTIAWQSDAVLVDSPTNGTASTGADPGGEVVGNYAVLNPLNSYSNTTLSKGNLRINSGNNWGSCHSTLAFDSGKYYYEFTADADQYVYMGVAVTDHLVTQYPSQGESWAYLNDGNCYYNQLGTGAITVNTGTAIADGDCIGCAIDMDSGKIWWSRNGSWLSNGSGTGNPATGVNPVFTNLPVGTHIYAAVDVYGNSGTVNFGQTKFKYAAPAGFKSLCSTNLPTPAISKPSNHVDAKPYAGNNTSNEQQLGFTPDILIIKKRSAGNAAGVVFDSIRGATKAIETSNASLEKTNDPAIGSFAAGSNNGFSLTGTYGQTNASGTDYAAWVWDAGETTNSVSTGGLNSSAYNTDEIWSNSLAAGSGQTLSNAVQAFNGNLADRAQTNNAGQNKRLIFSPPAITFTKRLEVYCDQGNATPTAEWNGHIVYPGQDEWVTVFEGSGQLSSTYPLVIDTESAAQFATLKAVRVDGKILLNSNISVPENIPTLATSYRATPSAGISLVSYSGSDSGVNSIAHGLNKAPELYIIKNRTQTSPLGFIVNTTVIDGSVDYAVLNKNNAAADQGSPWNRAPSSYAITLGSNDVNTCNAGDDYIAYCFHSVEGFSKFGTFQNVSDNSGAFVYCGFKPRIILAKNVKDLGGQTGVGDWMIYDTARNPRNGGDQNTIALNVPNAEDDFYNANQATIDILSNGFKVRHYGSSPFGDPSRLIFFAAWAENPFALNSRAT